ncbi:hypothetical protein MG293_006048 [Ovis ammon polii]|uniref:Uncharacterized protein n=1 Tax=Ovis ammon polii TaxID=230172 RepID=A0AAD4UEK0_OVIAM|nr:hypothetical protein MG293_006048 [Ovis ammon polii]
MAPRLVRLTGMQFIMKMGPLTPGKGMALQSLHNMAREPTHPTGTLVKDPAEIYLQVKDSSLFGLEINDLLSSGLISILHEFLLTVLRLHSAGQAFVAGKSTEQFQGSACGSITKLAASDSVPRLDEKWQYTREKVQSDMSYCKPSTVSHRTSKCRFEYASNTLRSHPAAADMGGVCLPEPSPELCCWSYLTPRKTQNSASGSPMRHPPHHKATVKILLLSWSDERWYSEGHSQLQTLVCKAYPSLLRGHLPKH